MAKEKGDLVDCLTLTLHHVAPHKPGIMAIGGSHIETSLVRHQFKRITAEVTLAIEHIKKIRAAAEQADCKEVLTVLDEVLEF